METQNPEFQKGIHELHDLGVTEVSLVRNPANRRQFAVYKSVEDPISEALEESSSEAALGKDFGASSLATQTRFGSGGHYTPSGITPPTKNSKREAAYLLALREAQKLVREGKYPTVDQAFTALLDKDPKFRSLITKHYYGWDDDADDEGIDPLSIIEKRYAEPLDAAIEKGLSDFPEDMSYEEKLEQLFKADRELELRWLFQK